MPSYYYWQQRPFEERKADLQNWICTLMPTYDAISVLLSILRKNSRAVNCFAKHGNYQHPSLAQNIHMLSIEVDEADRAIAAVRARRASASCNALRWEDPIVLFSRSSRPFSLLK